VTTIAQFLEVLACARPSCPCQRSSGRTGRTHCPAHDDQWPSLSVTERDGRLLVYCHAGCAQSAVIDALRSRGVWPRSRAGRR